MPVESAADLAGMFSSDDFAEAATYAPRADRALPSSRVDVIMTDALNVMAYGNATLRARSCLLRAAALAYEPQRGDMLTLPEGRFEVAARETQLDGAVYLLTLSAA